MGNWSWIRTATRKVLRKFFADPDVRNINGLFLSPFKAQAKNVATFFAQEELKSWSAATIHSQQGTEADFIIFDTANAGSCTWPYEEWKRLINVGLSWARQFVMLLSSRAEMKEPYLHPLLKDLKPVVLSKSGKSSEWKYVEAKPEYEVIDEISNNPERIGYQIRQRKSLRPVLSHQQQRLCGLKMDGKPRPVRGVVGSGKSLVFANWLSRLIKDRQVGDEKSGNFNRRTCPRS